MYLPNIKYSKTMLTINDIIETALAVDALQTHVSVDASGVDVGLRSAMERCAPAILAAVSAECSDADADDDAVRSAMEMLGAYRLLAVIYGGIDAARAEFYGHAAAEYATAVHDLSASRCPASHNPSWT